MNPPSPIGYGREFIMTFWYESDAARLTTWDDYIEAFWLYCAASV